MGGFTHKVRTLDVGLADHACHADPLVSADRCYEERIGRFEYILEMRHDGNADRKDGFFCNYTSLSMSHRSLGNLIVVPSHSLRERCVLQPRRWACSWSARRNSVPVGLLTGGKERQGGIFPSNTTDH